MDPVFFFVHKWCSKNMVVITLKNDFDIVFLDLSYSVQFFKCWMIPTGYKYLKIAVSVALNDFAMTHLV